MRHIRRHPGLRIFGAGLAGAMLVMLVSALLPRPLLESMKAFLAFLVAASAIVGLIGLTTALLSAVQQER